MHIRYGFDIELGFAGPTTLVTLMDIHPDRRRDIVAEEPLRTDVPASVTEFRDTHGNLARRITGKGRLRLRLEGVCADHGRPDPQARRARQMPVESFDAEALYYLMPSRYCETDLLAPFAWQTFGHVPEGWARVQAVCDFVHKHLRFSYPEACATRTARDALESRCGVCRDFTHLAIALCRALNIPARYCNGYLGDIGVPPDPAPMDFNAWFEVRLEDGWHTFDARHNVPRIGRLLIARGRDAGDVAMITSFGQHTLERFSVITEEVPRALLRPAA
jgi:transglutaminase-like putative cysteine protease